MHAVPGRAPALERVLRRATRPTATSRWSASCATTSTEGGRGATCSEHGIDWTIALDPGAQAALDFGTRGQPETFAISPTGRSSAYQLEPDVVAGLEAMLDGREAQRMTSRRWGPWIALGVVVVVAGRGPWPGRAVRRSRAERARLDRCRAQVPGVPGAFGRRQPGAHVEGDPRRHRRDGIASGQSDARDPPGVRRHVRRGRSCCNRRTRASSLIVWVLPVVVLAVGRHGHRVRAARATGESPSCTPPRPTSALVEREHGDG